MKRLALLQIDGLSYSELKRAISAEYMPYLADLVKSGKWHTKSIYSGIPSTTPASQLRLFYGLETVIPGFRFVMRPHDLVFSPFDAGSIGIIENKCRKQVPPLLAGGVSVLSIFNGSAKTAISAYSVRMDPRIKKEVFRFLFKPWRFFLLLVRILILILIEAGEHRQNPHKHHNFRLRLKNIFQRIMYELISGELLYGFVTKKLREGCPVLYTDFGGYDHLAHHYGPESNFGFYYLTVIDSYLKKILTDPKIKKYGYEFVILSDHGQTQAVTFSEEHGKSLHGLLVRKYPNRKILAETDPRSLGKIKPDHIYCLNSGGLCLIYDTHGRDKKTRTDLESHLPDFGAYVSGLKGIAAVFFFGQSGRINAIAKNQEFVFDGETSFRKIFPLIPAAESRQASRDITGIMLSDYAPDALIMTDLINQDLIYNLEEMYGTHGGVGGKQTEAFVMYRGSFLDNTASLSDCYGILNRLRND